MPPLLLQLEVQHVQEEAMQLPVLHLHRHHREPASLGSILFQRGGLLSHEDSGSYRLLQWI